MTDLKQTPAELAEEIAEKLRSGEFHGFAFVAFGKGNQYWGYNGLSGIEARAAPSYLLEQKIRSEMRDEMEPR